MEFPQNQFSYFLYTGTPLVAQATLRNLGDVDLTQLTVRVLGAPAELDAQGNGNFAAVERSLQWVVQHACTYNIVSVNMSFGDGGTYNRPQSLYGLGDELAVLAAQNVIVVSAAGNRYASNGNVQGVSYPAADPNVLAIGAVWEADVGGPIHWNNGATDYTTGADHIISFSQRSFGRSDVFAPGGLMEGAGPNNGLIVSSGTSMAAPVVSAVAALANEVAASELDRRLTPAEFRHLLHVTSDTIHDGSNLDDNVRNTCRDYRRLNVLALAEGIIDLKQGTLPADTTRDDTSLGHDTNLGHDMNLGDDMNLGHDSGTGNGALAAGAQTVIVTAGQETGRLRFGNVRLATLSGRVFDDVNGDGDDELGSESGLPARTVYIDANNNAAFDSGELSTLTGPFGTWTIEGFDTFVVVGGGRRGGASPALNRDSVAATATSST